MCIRTPFARCALAIALLGSAAAQAQVTTRLGGLVFDSLSRAPLAGAAVQLVNADNPAQTPSRTTSDSSGKFSIGQLSAGRYIATFEHPLLDSLGVQAPTYLVTVRDATPLKLDLATPSPARLRAEYCGAQSIADSTGAVVGYVRAARARSPLPAAVVAARWLELSIGGKKLNREVVARVAKSDETGRFVLCGIPLATDVTVQVARDADTTGTVPLRLPPAGIARRDFHIGAARRVTTEITDSLVTDSAGNAIAKGDLAAFVKRGDGQLTGIVRGMYNQPLHGVQIGVTGSGKTSTSDDRGQFTLRELPEGTQTLTARAVGYFPQEIAVDIFADTTATVALQMASLRSVLDTIRVVGKRVRSDKMVAFEERRRSRGSGTFLDSTWIKRVAMTASSDLIRQSPSLHIVPWFNRRLGRVVYMLRVRGTVKLTGSGLCLPLVFIDGMPIRLDADLREIDTLIMPADIQAMEMYTGENAPPEFSRFGNCASVVITTRW